jgi:hypothetical protein
VRLFGETIGRSWTKPRNGGPGRTASVAGETPQSELVASARDGHDETWRAGVRLGLAAQATDQHVGGHPSFQAGCAHQVVKTGSGAAAARTPGFKWVNTALGNIKAAIVGTYRAIDRKHVPRYLAEFEYRFNRRYDLAAMMPRLLWAGVRTTPMPYRLLKLADVYV